MQSKTASEIVIEVNEPEDAGFATAELDILIRKETEDEAIGVIRRLTEENIGESLVIHGIPNTGARLKFVLCCRKLIHMVMAMRYTLVFRLRANIMIFVFNSTPHEEGHLATRLLAMAAGII